LTGIGCNASIRDGSGARSRSNDIGEDMKIAIPVTYGQLSAHFGHCEQFALVQIERSSKAVLATDYVAPPPHEPGILPRWLHEQGVDVIIAGGMGQRAQGLFAQSGIEVVVGAKCRNVQETVADYLRGTLEVSENPCDH
jgi:ATP-binding protein involved in chromosome partitioning